MINTYIVQNWPLILLPHSDLQSEQYWFSRNQKPANFAKIWEFFSEPLNDYGSDRQSERWWWQSS